MKIPNITRRTVHMVLSLYSIPLWLETGDVVSPSRSTFGTNVPCVLGHGINGPCNTFNVNQILANGLITFFYFHAAPRHWPNVLGSWITLKQYCLSDFLLEVNKQCRNPPGTQLIHDILRSKSLVYVSYWTIWIMSRQKYGGQYF